VSARPHPSGLAANLVVDRALVMGVLNVTADSFSDGGQWLDTAAAVAHGKQLAVLGADIVDVGGESTRPGAQRVDARVESQRVLPVIAALAQAGICVSVDTMRAGVARDALAAGAAIVNDVSGGLADPEMLPALADVPNPVVLMHWRAHSAVMQEHARYDDVCQDVKNELLARVVAAEGAGIRRSRLILDPGIGFAKDAAQNWALLGGLGELVEMGIPVLVGASRKRFLGALLADTSGPRAVEGRESATTAVSGLAAQAGVWGVRVHDVAPSADAVRVAAAWAGRTAQP